MLEVEFGVCGGKKRRWHRGGVLKANRLGTLVDHVVASGLAEGRKVFCLSNRLWLARLNRVRKF
jgi:hypothetical protein